MVVNFDLPMDIYGRADCETYIHRIGRTGRFGRKGVAISFVDGTKSRKVLHSIKQYFGKQDDKKEKKDTSKWHMGLEGLFVITSSYTVIYDKRKHYTYV